MSASSFVAVATSAVLGVYLVLSVLNQFRGATLLRPLQRHDIVMLLPVWIYFSKLGVIDCVVMYRDRLDDGRVTPWQEHTEYRSSALRPLWNPGRRVRYGIYDACVTILARAGRDPAKPVTEHRAYRSLRNFVAQQPGTEASVDRQFMIRDTVAMERGTTKEPGILFVSPFHPLP